MTTKRILLIATSHGELGRTGAQTGLWLEELATPYVVFTGSGVEVDIASPSGGRPPIDPKSALNPTPAVAAFMNDRAAAHKLNATRQLAVVHEPYDAYFVVGGHGAMWDLAIDANVQAILASAYEARRVVSAVCHGPAALINVRLGDGTYLLKGKRVAGFSNAEEDAVGLAKVVPFSLESMLIERGGAYACGPLWAPFAVTDGLLITGQNPASSALVASKVLEAIGVAARRAP